MEPKKEIMNQLNYVRKWKTKFITAIPKLKFTNESFIDRSFRIYWSKYSETAIKKKLNYLLQNIINY